MDINVILLVAWIVWTAFCFYKVGYYKGQRDLIKEIEGILDEIQKKNAKGAFIGITKDKNPLSCKNA